MSLLLLSELNDNNILNKDFQINWPRPKEDYYTPENSSKRIWFELMERNFCEDLKKDCQHE